MEKQIIVKNMKDCLGEQLITVKMIKDLWFIIAFMGLFPAILGIYNYITFPLFVVVLVGMIIWGKRIIKHNQTEQFMLYSGTGLLITSLECLLGVFKIFAMDKLLLLEGLLIVFIYVIFITVYSIGYIKKVHQELNRKKKTVQPFIYAAPLMGILVGKSLKDVLNNDQVFLVLAFITLILALLLGMGIKYLINHHYIKKYNIQPE